VRGNSGLDLVVHHLFAGVVLCEDAEQFNDAGILYTTLQLSRRSQEIETHTSASNLIVKRTSSFHNA